MATDGLIDIHFSESFLEYAKTSVEDDSFLNLKYHSKPASLLANSNSIGTIWSTSSSEIHASFPSSSSSSSSKPHNFTSTTTPTAPPTPNPSTCPELLLIFSPTSNSYVLHPPPTTTVDLKLERSNNNFPPVPRVPTNEELGKQTREFWEGESLNPFNLISHTQAQGLGIENADTVMKDDDDDDEEEEGKGQPKLAQVPSYLRNPASTTTTEVEDFGSISFGPPRDADSTATRQLPPSSSTTSTTGGLVLPRRKKSSESLETRNSLVEPSRSPILPPLPTPSVPLQPNPPRPQFSSKIPASSQRNFQTPTTTTTTNDAASDPSSEDEEEEEDDDDVDFEDVSVPIPQPPQPSSVVAAQNLPALPHTRPPPLPPQQAPVASSSTHSPASSSTSRSNNHQRLSTSLRNIIDPPSSPVVVPPTGAKPRPSAQQLPSSQLPPSRPTIGGKLPTAALVVKKRKNSLLPEDQASSDSSSSDSDDDDDSNSNSEDDLEASINAQMSVAGGGTGVGKVAMSSGGKGRRQVLPPPSSSSISTTLEKSTNGIAVGGGGGARPTISRKGLAPPANPNISSTSSGSGAVGVGSAIPSASGRQTKGSRPDRAVAGGSTISAYDAQRLAQYGSNYPALHSRSLSNNVTGGVGGTASPVIGAGRVELESSGEDDDDDDDESASDSD